MNETFSTATVDSAAYLLTRGAIFVGLTVDRPNHAVFVFQDKDLCEELHKEYLNNAAVPAREILARKKELVDQLNTKLAESRSSYKSYR